MKQEMTTKLRKHYPGCYRLTLPREHFAQIKRDGRLWLVEIRNEDATIVRYGGIWDTLAIAAAEAEIIGDRL